MGVFQAIKMIFLLQCSRVYISVPCGERQFIAYAGHVSNKTKERLCLFMICLF